MMRKRLVYALLVLAIGFLGCYFYRKTAQTELTHFPVAKDGCPKAPYFHVEIGETQYTMKLDLGAGFDLAMEKNLLEQLEPKEEIGEVLRWGVLGKQYRVRQYRIPNARSKGLFFDSPIIDEESVEWKRDSLFNKQDLLLRKDHGSVGWKLFSHCLLLLDYKHQKIAFYNKINDLKLDGYCLEDFVKRPLLTDRGFLECEMKLDGKKIRGLLDTGCFASVVHRPIEDGICLEEIPFNPSWKTSITSFQIGEKDFGSMQIRQFPIQTPIQIEAILGLDFFRDFTVIIDFPEKQVYFWRCDHPDHACKNQKES